MRILIAESEDAALLVEQEEILRRQEEASTKFLEALMREAEEIKDRREWETCPMI